MSTQNENTPVEGEVNESDDDGFEVLDPEPEQDQEPDGFKYLSRTDFTNAGTIIFCHMDDEYSNIQQVRCQYIRPEGWSEKEKDEIAIFEVGWINTEEAVAKIPVDLTIATAYPLGSVNLTDLSFREEDFVEFPGAVSHFQFCYLRDGGVLLGASTPFGIRDIKSVGRIPLITKLKPVFLPSVTADITDFYPERSSLFELAAANVPSSFKHDHNKLFLESEAVHDVADASVGVELSALQSTLRNIKALTKRLKNGNFQDKSYVSEYTAELILELTESVDELTAEMQKATGALPSASSVNSSSPEAREDLEHRFRSCAAQLKANLQDCTRTFDLCKVAIKNQTPPSSLSELERSDFVRETEWKRQEETEELKRRLKKAEEQIEKLRLELSQKETEHNELRVQAAQEELSVKEERNQELTKQLHEMETQTHKFEQKLLVTEAVQRELTEKLDESRFKLKTETDKLSLKETECQELKKALEEAGSRLRTVTEELASKEIGEGDMKCRIREVEEKMYWKEREMMSQLEDMGRKLGEVYDKLMLEEANHGNYVAEAEKEKKEIEVKMAALSDESSILKAQIQSLLDEAKLYKSKLGETILDLASARKEADSLKEQCKTFVQRMNFLENDKTRLMGCIDALREKQEQKVSKLDDQHDILVQEFLKKSEELDVAKQQVDNFQEELSRLHAQRTNLQKELLEERKKPAICEKPCCTYDILPNVSQPDQVVQSILEALEQSLQQNKGIQEELETEKKRSQVLEEKLHTAAGKQRSLYTEKITLESRLKELLGIINIP